MGGSREGGGSAIPSPAEVAERVIAVLDEGHFTSTYKYAVLLALLDLCLEKGTEAGPTGLALTTRELAEKVLAIYWPQVRPSPLLGGRTLSQSASGARILSRIERFKALAAADPPDSPTQARARHPRRFAALLRDVERVLIELPLPRLQTIGRSRDEFLYHIGWDTAVDPARVREYLAGRPSGFDNRILLRPGVPEALAQLNGVLRPLVQRSWALKVARLNRLEDARLHDFLFGEERAPLERVRAPLVELQEGRCFLCETPLARQADLDHFIPWARVPNDNLENLVAVHPRCNNQKRDFLPALPHVERWASRLQPGAPVLPRLERIARAHEWPCDPPASLGVARTIYRRLPPSAKLWLRDEEFVERGKAVVGF